MKKILIACRAYYPDIGGGGEISTKTLAENLISAGYDVTVLAIADINTTDIISGVKVNRLKHKNIYWSMKNSDKRAIKKIIWHFLDANNILIQSNLMDFFKKISPDILITSTIEDVSSVIWKVAKLQGIRVIHILRSYSLMCINANMFRQDNCIKQCISCKFITYRKKYNSAYVDDVVGISSYILHRHIDAGYFNNANKHIIYNICIDNIISSRDNNFSENNEIKIGYLGRVHRTKGIELIFDALSYIPYEVRRKILLSIAGSGDREYIHELNGRARKNNINCIFLGNLNANEFFNEISLLIVPSRWNEPFGRVVIESMANGVPVIGSDVGGIPELLSDNKEFLFKTAEELSVCIKRFLDRKNNFNFKLERFLTEKIVKDWVQLLG